MNLSNNDNIVFVVTSFPTITETFIINQIVSVIKAGYSVRVFAEKIVIDTVSSQKYIIETYSLMEKCQRLFHYSNSTIENLKKFFKILSVKEEGCVKYLFNCFKSCKFGLYGFGLYPFIKTVAFLNSNAKIYHAQFGPNGKLLVMAKKYGAIDDKSKIITTFHGYDVSLESLTYEDRIKYYKDLFKVGDLFTANTQYLAEQLIRLGCPEDKLHIVPMGVDISFFKPNHKKSKNQTINLLSAGRLIDWKSFDLGIQAVEALVKQGFDIHYTIVGDGDQKNYLYNLVQELNIDPYVSFKGALNQNDVLKCMQESDLFLMTSTYNEEGRKETQGVVTIEAQACGLPVCAFRSGGVPYTIKENETGFLAEEKNIEEYVLIIKRMLEKPKLRKQMGKNARSFVEQNYSLTLCSEKMINFYKKFEGV